MKPLARKRPRACVAILLILSVLGLGGFDVAICRGVDGHLGIETRVGSCCCSVSEALSSLGPAGLHSTAPALGPAEDAPSCEHTPIIHSTPAAHANPLAGVFLVWSMPSWCTEPDDAVRVIVPPLRIGSLPVHLRSTTLLI